MHRLIFYIHPRFSQSPLSHLTLTIDFLVISKFTFFSVISNKPQLHGREMKGWARFSGLMSKVPNKAQLIYRQTDRQRYQTCVENKQLQSILSCWGGGGMACGQCLRRTMPFLWTCVHPVIGTCCLHSLSSCVYLQLSPSWPDTNGFTAICSWQTCNNIAVSQTGLWKNSSDRQEVSVH